ncbi:MAG: M24 family metallopeptidase [Chloroflexota bacterium]
MTTSEFDEKQKRIQRLLEAHQLDALLLQRVSSFAWATCGAASYVNTATTDGESALLITPNGRCVITNNIEAPRLEQEESLRDQGWTFRVTPWFEAQDTVAALTRGLNLGADGPYAGATDLSGELARLRANLTPQEVERFRKLGRLCAEAMDSAIRAVRPGQSEYEIAGLLARQSERRGAQAIVNLVATDERIFSFRHPLPTHRVLDRYAMLVLCGRKWGLVCSLTRLVHFGPLPDDLRRKARAVAQIDGTFILTTRPGRTLGDVLRRATAAYAETGFPDEWRLHHQGGPAGYEPREVVATPDATDVVSVGQAYAWNPSITGTKSEDTMLVGEEGNELLTSIEGWPTMTVTVDGEAIRRPAILERV